jgi:SPX domain protein involved in polyphosphate accumulation
VWKSNFTALNRVDLHAIEATPARWRGDAGSSPLDRARTAHPTHWLISTQVKERFVVTPDEVLPLLRGEFDPRAPRKKPYAPHELALCDEVQGLIARKHLVPTIRSQCHRVAYQLAHSNSVRCSIDTNLTLVNEIQKAEFEPVHKSNVAAHQPLNLVSKVAFTPKKDLVCTRHTG